jgi:alcohol dehydrogenase YqhD (iron-dependent ADH family)
MNNFTFHIPTKIHFGRGQIEHLNELAESGERVLLVYGGGSIKRLGIYDATLRHCADAGLKVFELSGVEPNPRIQTVRKGVEMCSEHGIDMVLAVGGGSTIDCAKMVAAGAKYEGDSWDLVIHPELIKDALPIYAVLTLAATGSEMDMFAVISDMDKHEKWGTSSPHIKPRMSILNPEYTFSVSRKQTAAGVADMMSHIFENYFTNVSAVDVQKGFAESLLKCIIKYGPIALNCPENYDARANLMWAGSFAINGLLSNGAEVAWCVHPMEHELSAFYDITHGEGLAILTVSWMDYVLCEKTSKKFADYGRNVCPARGHGSGSLSFRGERTCPEHLFLNRHRMSCRARAGRLFFRRLQLYQDV